VQNKDLYSLRPSQTLDTVPKFEELESHLTGETRDIVILIPEFTY